MAKKMRNGKAYEHTVVGILTLADFDVYMPVVDDQGIDGILRVRGQAAVRYFDFQVKGSRDWKVRCWTEHLPIGGVLFVYCDKTKELL